VLPAYPTAAAALASWARVPHARRVSEVREHWDAEVRRGARFELGDREVEESKVAVRERTKGDIGAMSIDEFKQMATRLVSTRALTNN